jgi:hypothetical protein
MEPRRGVLAICSRGELGLITSNTRMRVYYKRGDECSRWQEGEHSALCDCETGIAWVGIHLAGDKAGQPWSSREPVVVGTIESFIEHNPRTRYFKIVAARENKYLVLSKD